MGNEPLLQFFSYEHLPPHLQVVSRPFCDLAVSIVDTLPGIRSVRSAFASFWKLRMCGSRMPDGAVKRPKPSVDPVSAYAWDVIHGKIVVGGLVQTGVRAPLSRHPKQQKDRLRLASRYRDRGDRVRPYCRHTKGEWAGQRVEFQPWQQFVHGSAFGWLRKDGLRRFRVVYEEIARKNGKSLSASVIALKCLVADGEPGADVFSAATKKDQARIVFDEARRNGAAIGGFAEDRLGVPTEPRGGRHDVELSAAIG